MKRIKMFICGFYNQYRIELENIIAWLGIIGIGLIGFVIPLAILTWNAVPETFDRTIPIFLQYIFCLCEGFGQYLIGLVIFALVAVASMYIWQKVVGIYEIIRYFQYIKFIKSFCYGIIGTKNKTINFCKTVRNLWKESGLKQNKENK